MNDIHLRTIAAQLARLEMNIDALSKHLGLPPLGDFTAGPWRYTPLINALYCRFAGAGFTAAEAIAAGQDFAPLNRVLTLMGCHTAVALSRRFGGMACQDLNGLVLRKHSGGGARPTTWVIAPASASVRKGGRPLLPEDL